MAKILLLVPKADPVNQLLDSKLNPFVNHTELMHFTLPGTSNMIEIYTVDAILFLTSERSVAPFQQPHIICWQKVMVEDLLHAYAHTHTHTQRENMSSKCHNSWSYAHRICHKPKKTWRDFTYSIYCIHISSPLNTVQQAIFQKSTSNIGIYYWYLSNVFLYTPRPLQFSIQKCCDWDLMNNHWPILQCSNLTSQLNLPHIAISVSLGNI